MSGQEMSEFLLNTGCEIQHFRKHGCSNDELRKKLRNVVMCISIARDFIEHLQKEKKDE